MLRRRFAGRGWIAGSEWTRVADLFGRDWLPRRVGMGKGLCARVERCLGHGIGAVGLMGCGEMGTSGLGGD